MNNSERIRTFLKSWEIVNKGSKDEDESNAGDAAAKAATVKTTEAKKIKGWGFMQGATSKADKSSSEDPTSKEKSGGKGKGNSNGTQNVPTTYPEMFSSTWP